MRKPLFTLSILLIYILRISAQDSLSLMTKASDTTAINPILYNFSSPTLNNAFNTGWRHDARNRVNIDFDYFMNANGVPASFGFNMIFKREITDALKDRTDNRIKKMLRFEDFMKTGVSYEHYIQKWDGKIILGYHHRQMRIIGGSKQTYELLFYGNARFEGDTADLSNLVFKNFIYNQYSIGIEKTIDYGKYQFQFGIGGAFLQCINNQQIQTREAWLYTAPDADSLVLNYDLTFNNSREGATKATQLNGAGASVDFSAAFMNKNKWKISLDLFDVGYMTFRKAPVNYTAAKYVSFRGIVLPELSTFTSETFDTLRVDSAVKANLPAKTNNQYALFLPFTAQLIFSKPLMHDRLILNIGVQYRHLPGYYAYGFAKVNYFIKRDMVFSASLGGGAYSWANLGVEFSKSWKYFDFTIGTANLLGLCAPSYFPGTSVYLRLGSAF
jgi:hypothetical protein